MYMNQLAFLQILLDIRFIKLFIDYYTNLLLDCDLFDRSEIKFVSKNMKSPFQVTVFFGHYFLYCTCTLYELSTL